MENKNHIESKKEKDFFGELEKYPRFSLPGIFFANLKIVFFGFFNAVLGFIILKIGLVEMIDQKTNSFAISVIASLILAIITNIVVYKITKKLINTFTDKEKNFKIRKILLIVISIVFFVLIIIFLGFFYIITNIF